MSEAARDRQVARETVRDPNDCPHCNPDGHQYRCNHCGKTVRRKSEKQWINSYCETTSKTTRLWRIK